MLSKTKILTSENVSADLVSESVKNLAAFGSHKPFEYPYEHIQVPTTAISSVNNGTEFNWLEGKIEIPLLDQSRKYNTIGFSVYRIADSSEDQFPIMGVSNDYSAFNGIENMPDSALRTEALYPSFVLGGKTEQEFDYADFSGSLGLNYLKNINTSNTSVIGGKPDKGTERDFVIAKRVYCLSINTRLELSLNYMPIDFIYALSITYFNR